MKGPYQRLTYDLRRQWECPECHHHERHGGHVTFVFCHCQKQKKPMDRVVMKLIDDQPRRMQHTIVERPSKKPPREGGGRGERPGNRRGKRPRR